jgi:agmatine/peptidylarginine deiminase
MPAATGAGTRLGRPSPAALAQLFKQQTGYDYQPPPSAVYQNNTPSPVHAVPEFAPMGGVLIAYPGTVSRPAAHIQLPPSGPRMFGIPDELIVRLQQADSDCPVRVFVLCDNPAELDAVREGLAKVAGERQLAYDPQLIHFVPWDTDTYWTRDYGPWWVENDEAGRLGIAKHIYTSLGGGSVGLVEGAEHVSPREGLGIFRPNDDSAAVKLSDFLNTPVRSWDAAEWHGKKLPQIPPHDWYCTGLLEVGGNYMVTGDGRIASTYLVATQNELPVPRQGRSDNPAADVIAHRMEYVLGQLNRFMGVQTYHVLQDPTGSYIGHIDCWGKFLAPRKVLIADSEDPAVSAKFAEIAASFAAEGFEVYRVMCQDVYIPQADTPATTAAYTNSLILNDRVYVPVAGPPHEERDKAALAVYGEALPGYQVIGIPGKPEAPWLGTDALHCRTHGIPRRVIDNWLHSQSRG